MPNTHDLGTTPRRELHIFYVLDTSGSMTGTPIATLNSAMTETLEVLRQQAKSNADALVKVAVLEFNSGCHWLQPRGPEEMEHFIWEDLQAGGLTDIGAALKELDSKLSRNEFLSSMTGAYLPVIIFMTDGYATDDYKKALEQINQNKWFTHGTKIGFAVGSEADVAMVSEIVGTSEAVVRTDDLELFARMLKFASVTASMLCSTSRTSSDPVTGKVILNKAKLSGMGISDVEEPDTPDMSDLSDAGDLSDDDSIDADDFDFDVDGFD